MGFGEYQIFVEDVLSSTIECVDSFHCTVFCCVEIDFDDEFPYGVFFSCRIVRSNFVMCLLCFTMIFSSSVMCSLLVLGSFFFFLFCRVSDC